MKDIYKMFFRLIFVGYICFAFILDFSLSDGSEKVVQKNMGLENIFSGRSFYAGLDPFRDINNFDKYEIQRLEYPVATEVWEYLKLLDYSNEVCSGIIGNMMVECGGGTLHLNPYIYSKNKNYYGICQWSKKYYSEVFNKDTVGQLEYLSDNIEYEINTYGGLYKKGFLYSDFVGLKDPEQVALSFAKCYERCSKGSYSYRQKCSLIAYEYFR